MPTPPFVIDLSPAFFSVATYPPGATFGPRSLKNWEFVWMLEGDAVYTYDDISVEAPEGSLVLCRPGLVDHFRWDPHRRTRHAYFHFEVQGDFPAEWPECNSWPPVRNPPRESDLLRPLFRHLISWAGQGDSIQTALLAASLLAAYVTGETTSREVAGRGGALPEAVDRAWSYILHRLEEAPSDSLPLAELAQAACVTPAHLCRLFKSATGYSPAQTVRLARLDRSVVLLTRTNYSVAEIAALCGFESPFHFSRRFKDAFGHSPRELRQAVAKGELPPITRLLQNSH